MLYFQSVIVVAETLLAAAILGLLGHSLIKGVPAIAGRSRRMAGDICLYFCVFVFIGSGISKFFHVPLAVTEMTLLHLSGTKYLLVATLEIASGLITLMRPLRSIALPFVSAHVGGAICAHLIAGQYFAMLPSAAILSLFWLGMFLRHPQILWSLDIVAKARHAEDRDRLYSRSVA